MIAAICKVNSICNLNCSYCYYLSLPHLAKPKSENMQKSILEKTISEILALEANERKALFIWHGGEPLVNGLDFFHQILNLQEKYRKPHQKIINSIQTNATLLTPEWVEFFKNRDFSVGISIDGPEYVHNIHRTYPSKLGSFQDVLQGISLLRSADIHFFAIVVVTRESLRYAEEIYRFLVKIGIGSFDFLPYMDICPKNGMPYESAITVMDFTNFLIRVLDLWLEDDNPNIHIRTYEQLLIGLLGGTPSLCRFAGTCSQYLTIQPSGDVYPCDNFSGYLKWNLGNVSGVPINSILRSQRYQEFICQTNISRFECVDCQWYSICNGGCSWRRYMSQENIYDRQPLCLAWKTLLEYLSQHVTNILGNVPFISRTKCVSTNKAGV